MADVPDGDALLLAEHLVGEELLLDLDASLQSRVVHALGTSEGPAVPALALAVVLWILRTGGVYYSPC